MDDHSLTAPRRLAPAVAQDLASSQSVPQRQEVGPKGAWPVAQVLGSFRRARKLQCASDENRVDQSQSRCLPFPSTTSFEAGEKLIHLGHNAIRDSSLATTPLATAPNLTNIRDSPFGHNAIRDSSHLPIPRAATVEPCRATMTLFIHVPWAPVCPRQSDCVHIGGARAARAAGRCLPLRPPPSSLTDELSPPQFDEEKNDPTTADRGLALSARLSPLWPPEAASQRRCQR